MKPSSAVRRDMHLSERRHRIVCTGGKDKAMVSGMFERGGRVRGKGHGRSQAQDDSARDSSTRSRRNALYSDDRVAYNGLQGEYTHQVKNHAVQYADGRGHTNGMENFWSLLKRGISGTYVSVEAFRLFRYLDEQIFRYNNGKELDDAGGFDLAVRQIVGKRIAFAQLTGKPN